MPAVSFLTATAHAQPTGVTLGPDGAIWFTEPGINSIGRLPISGYPLSEFPVPTKNSDPIGIATGTDNAVWFTEQRARNIGRISVTGVVTAEYPLTNSVTPNALIQGVDGNFYFTDTAKNKIAQFLFRSHRCDDVVCIPSDVSDNRANPANGGSVALIS